MEPEEPAFEDIKTKQHGILREFFDFAMDNKKYWIIPIVVILMAFGALLIIGGSSAAPFIYTLF